MVDVLYRRGQLGDVVLLGGVTAALGQVEVATDPRWHEVVGRLRGVVGTRAATRWQAPWVDLQGEWRSLGRRRIRKHSIRRRWWLHFGGRAPRPLVPELYARALGVRPAPPPWIELERVPGTLVLVPGASTALKRPARELLAALAERWSGPVAVIGGPGEATDLPGEHAVGGGFEHVFDVLSRASVVVGGDTGLVHLAAACGVPVVGVFGPTHPDDGFWCWDAPVVQRDLPCRPCTLHRGTRCALGSRPCMDIELEPLWRAVESACAG